MKKGSPLGFFSSTKKDLLHRKQVEKVLIALLDKKCSAYCQCSNKNLLVVSLGTHSKNVNIIPKSGQISDNHFFLMNKLIT